MKDVGEAPVRWEECGGAAAAKEERGKGGGERESVVSVGFWKWGVGEEEREGDGVSTCRSH